jgi:predicted dehydrogenase
MHSTSELGVAVVGLGHFGSKRIQALGADGRARLCVVADVLPDRAQSVAEELGCVHTENWERAVTWPGVQIVIVSTPTQVLSQIAAAAVEAGQHVLVEKPFGRNAGEVWPVVAAAERKGLCLQVGYNHRYHPALAKAHALLEEGAIGRLHFLRCVYGHGGRRGYEQEWRTQPQFAGGGQLLDQGVHALDLFRWFAGGFTQVKACATTAFWPIAPLEDNIFAVLEAANGSVASLHASWTQWKATFLFEVSGEEGYLSVQGLGGNYGPERLCWGRRGELGSRPEEEWCEFEGPDESLHDEWADFLDCVLKGRQPPCSGRDGWQTLVLADAIYRSAREQGVAVPARGNEQVREAKAHHSGE